MKKKTIGRLAAVSLAAMTAASSLAVTVSANLTVDQTNSNYVSGTVYHVSIPNSVGVNVPHYYSTQAAATAAATAAGVSSSNVTEVNVTTLPSSTIYLDANSEVFTTAPSGTSTKYFTGSVPNGTTNPSGAATVLYPYQSSSNLVYEGFDGKFYPNIDSVWYATGRTYKSYKPSTYSATNCYLNTTTGVYYSSNEDGTYVWIRNGSYADNKYYYNEKDWGTYDVYYVNGRYYPTLAEAQNASQNGKYIISKEYDYDKPQTNYFCYSNGNYYTTYELALQAAGGNASNVRTFNYYAHDFYYDGYYGNYYYNGIYYGDPYYYYWMSKYGTKDDDDSSNSNDTTTAAIGKRKGWTAVAKYLGNLKSGSSVKVSMNYETIIPSSVTSAIKGKNVTVQFVLKNGTVFTINGKDISSAKDININTAYNTDNVPSKLVKAAYKKNKAVSTAQISIDSDSFGAAADITVKFATKRAGYTAKLYRYNPSKKTLSLVDSSKIQDNGKCTFGEVTKGGDFVIVIC